MVDNLLRSQISKLIREKAPRRLVAAIEQCVKESLVLKSTKRRDDRIAIGKSKLGGMPDLPPDVKWPVWKKKPHSFIAQINLSDLPSFEFLNALPKNGILSFFNAVAQEDWFLNEHDKGSWRVFYFDEQDLVRRDFPPDLSEIGIYRSCSLDFEASFTLPDNESPHIDLDWDKPEQRAEIDQYVDLWESFYRLVGVRRSDNRHHTTHRLLGHPDEIQGYLLLEAQLGCHGLDRGDSDPRIKRLKAGAANWELLLQIDTDSDIGMEWGDTGRIYYLMTSEQMRSRDFDATWMILQCT